MSLSLKTGPAVEMTGTHMHFTAIPERLLFNLMAKRKHKDNIDIFSPFFFYVFKGKVPKSETDLKWFNIWRDKNVNKSLESQFRWS